MLLEKAGEVTEPYVYEFINSLSEAPEKVTRWDGINIGNTLSLHLKNYVKNQLNNPEDDEIVAEDEPPENSTSDPSGNLTDAGNISCKNVPILGKSKKDKEKALKNGDLHDHLVNLQDIEVTKINKKRTQKKFKVKVWREWH